MLSQNEFCSVKTKPERGYELVSCEAIRTLDCTTTGNLYLWGRDNLIKSPFAFVNRVSERPPKERIFVLLKRLLVDWYISIQVEAEVLG